MKKEHRERRGRLKRELAKVEREIRADARKASKKKSKRKPKKKTPARRKDGRFAKR